MKSGEIALILGFTVCIYVYCSRRIGLEGETAVMAGFGMLAFVFLSIKLVFQLLKGSLRLAKSAAGRACSHKQSDES